MYWRPVITTTDHNGVEHRLSDDTDRQWFSHETPQGSGFGSLRWKLRRKVGYDYDDIGFAYPVVMHKGPFKVLFSGQIVKITERGDTEIEVWALGWVHVTANEPYNYIYCDNRWSKWRGSEDPSGSFRPDRFDWDTNNRLYLKPRRGVDYDADDYTYMRYTFPFGETAAKVTFNYDIAFPASWPGKVELLDSNGVSLWSKTTTASGTGESLTTSGSPTYLEVRFYCTSAGENTATDDTVYGKLTNVKIYSKTNDPLDASVVAGDIVTTLSATGHGLSDDVGEIEEPGLDLAPCFFDTDMSCKDALTWCCQFGDSDGNPLVWGVTFDDDKKIYLKTLDTTTVSYVVKKAFAEVERAGDWSESAQKVYGVLQDSQGNVERRGDYEATAVIDDDLGGYYIRRPLQITGTADGSLVDKAVSLWLEENKKPVVSGTFRVCGGVYTPEGRFIPFDEVVPGGLVQITEWRAVEATLTSDDYRDKTTTFQLAGVKVDEDTRTVELIPRTARNKFERYMAVIQELAQ